MCIRDRATTTDAEGMIKEGREIAAIHPNMVVKIPMTVEGLKAVKVLHAEGIKTNVTLIFSAAQALFDHAPVSYTHLVIVVPPDFYRKEKADIPHRNICHQSVSYPGTENCNSCFRYPYPLTLEHGLNYLQSVRLASHKPIPKEASCCLPPTGSSL